MKLINIETYCARLRIPKPGAAYLHRLVSSDPARRVRSAGTNVTVRYPSRKNGFVVQAESRTVELPYIFKLEYDDKVLAYYDQPESINLSYLSKTGRNTGVLHTPDFCVLRDEGVEWVECKAEDELFKLVEEMPNRYRRSEGGAWVCPPGEETAGQFGFRYRVVSSMELNPIFTRNVLFMADYMDERAPEFPSDVRSRVLSVVGKRVGIPMKELLELLPETTAAEVYSMIGRGELHVDLSRAPIAEHDKVIVFGSSELACACEFLSGTFPQSESPNAVLVAIGTELLWHDRRYVIANYNAEIIVLTAEGKALQINRDAFDAAVARKRLLN